MEGTLPGGGYETIQLHRFHAATECFAETIDTISIPPHSDKLLRTSKRLIRYVTLYSMAGVAMEGRMFRIPSSSMDSSMHARHT